MEHRTAYREHGALKRFSEHRNLFQSTGARFGASERVSERASERVSERALERVSEHRSAFAASECVSELRNVARRYLNVDVPQGHQVGVRGYEDGYCSVLEWYCRG